MSIVVHTTNTPATFIAPVKKAVADFLPDRPVSSFDNMEDVVRNSTGSRRFPMLLLSVFSVVALVLAAVGVAGVVSHSVAQRTHEIGIRMALGANRAHVLRSVLGQACTLAMLGIFIGAVDTAATIHLVQGMLYGVTAHGTIALSIAAAALMIVAIFASARPAFRAASIDPLQALRNE
jgi:putative ABC transport system permease protein